MKRQFGILLCMLALLAGGANALESGDCVFGPKALTISPLHVHLSTHQFYVDAPCEGNLVLNRSGGDPAAWGFVVLNRTVVSLADFLAGSAASYTHAVALTEHNRLLVLLVGTPGTSIRLAVHRPSPAPPLPELSLTVEPAHIQAGECATLMWSSENAAQVIIDNGIGAVSAEGSISVCPQTSTLYSAVAVGPLGTCGAEAQAVVLGDPAPLPEETFGKDYEHLIPVDAVVEAFDPERFALVSGMVVDGNDAALEGVQVSILGSPQYGTVQTDATGRYSLPIEGGGEVQVMFRSPGTLTLQRRVNVPWNAVAYVETVQMPAIDPESTIVQFDGDPQTVVTHQSGVTSDAFGGRSCRLVFSGDNQAFLVDENGNDVEVLEAMTVRATEYRTPAAMPAQLPPRSAFTYCVELGVDGAANVRFEKPVAAWVDNFLGFSVGEIIPVGRFDRSRGVWLPAENGVVVKLLDTDADGVVDALDKDGDDLPDDLNGDGLFTDEVVGMDDPQAAIPGATFWRFVVDHFSPWDCNLPFGAPPDAEWPNAASAPNIDEQRPEDNAVLCVASHVEQQSRILHQDIDIPGTSLSLHYASNRAKGYHTIIDVPVSGDTLPDSLKKIKVVVDVAGRHLVHDLAALPNQVASVDWDGRDYLGQVVGAPVTANVRVGFVYDSEYYRAGPFEEAFGQAGSESTGVPGREEIVLWAKKQLRIHPPASRVSGDIADGWSFSRQHRMHISDPAVLHKGDGRMIDTNVRYIDKIAGMGWGGYTGDNKPAVATALKYPSSVVVDKQGNVFFTDVYNVRVRKIDRAGIITTLAGNGSWGYSGDGGPATSASFMRCYGIAADDAGNVYISDAGNCCVRVVNDQGMIYNFAGSGSAGYSGDNGPAAEAQLRGPSGLAKDGSGNLYIADTLNHCIRKVDPRGIITTIAGTGTYGFSGDGGPATAAQLAAPLGVAVDRDGNILVSDTANHCIRRIDTAGIITTIAGTGVRGFSGDGGPAVSARLFSPNGIAVDDGGHIIVADEDNCRIRRINSNGIITTLAGSGTYAYSVSGKAAAATFRHPTDVAVDHFGHVIVVDETNHLLRKIAHPMRFGDAITAGGNVFAEADGRGHIISAVGRHSQTVDLDSGAVFSTFGYDENHRLISITDAWGNITRIERDAAGVATNIVAPDGPTTTLTIDADQRLTRLTFPDGRHYDFEYSARGMLTAKIEPAGNRFAYAFDALGRLSLINDPVGGSWEYSRTTDAFGGQTVRVTSAEENQTVYRRFTDSTGAHTAVTIDPCGDETTATRTADGLVEQQLTSCGTHITREFDLDPEYHHQVVKTIRETTPLGLEKETNRTRAYQDIDWDQVPDVVSDTLTINDRTTLIENDIPAAQKTITSPAGRSRTLYYDPETLAVTCMAVPGLHETCYEYDSKGRLSSITAGERMTTFGYGENGFLTSIFDADGNRTFFERDLTGRSTQKQEPATQPEQFVYDANGNLAGLSTPSGIEHFFHYNEVNQKIRYQTPVSGVYDYQYDSERQLTRIDFPSGRSISHWYEAGRPVQIQTPAYTVDIAYGCGGKIDSLSSGPQSLDFAYDGRLITEEQFSGTLNQTISYGYNHFFERTDVTYAGESLHLDYDADGLLVNAGAFAIERDPQNGLPTSVTAAAMSLDRAFNGYGEIDAMEMQVNGRAIGSWQVVRDKLGRIVQRFETVAGETTIFDYYYDAAGRLTGVDQNGTPVEQYTYGADGMRISDGSTFREIADRVFTYSAENHLLTAGEASYTYDADGFLTSRTTGEGTTLFQYALRGELLSVQLTDGTLIEYEHDPMGRRIAKKVNGMLMEKYLWHGRSCLLAVLDQNGNPLQRFTYADDRVPLSMTAGGNVYYLFYDATGSLRQIVDAGGNVVKALTYDAFGNVLQDTNPALAIPIAFAGGLYDPDTGLIRFGHRDYDPDIGRWTAKDPIFFDGGDADLYGYCLDDPVNLVDGDGLLAQSLVAGITAGAITGTISFVTEVAKGESPLAALKTSAMTALTSSISVGLAASGVGAVYSGATAVFANSLLQLVFEKNINVGSAFFSALPPSFGGVLLGKAGLNGFMNGIVTGIISGPSTVAGNAFFSDDTDPCK